MGAYIVTSLRNVKRFDKGQFMQVIETPDGNPYPERGGELTSRVVCNNSKSTNWLECRVKVAVQWEDEGVLLTILRGTVSKSKVLTASRELFDAAHDGSGRGR